MGILDKVKSCHFVINLGITLVLSGLIMVYVKQKFLSYDRQINQQNNLLKQLVSMVQNKASLPEASLAASGAVDAAKVAHKQFSMNSNDNKIKVSDSESSNTDSESDSESDEESDTEDENNENDEKSEDTIEIQREDKNKKPFHDFSEIKQIIITNSSEGNMLDNLHNLLSTSRQLSNMNLEKVDSLIESLDLDNLNELNYIENGNESGSESDSELSSDSDSDNEDDNENDNEDIKSELIKNMNLKKELSYDENSEININNLNDNLELMSMSTYQNKVIENTNDEQLKQNNDEDKLKLNYLVDMSKSQLQELCKSKNLSVKGSKKELIDRILGK